MIAKMAITECKLDDLDCHNIDFGNGKCLFLAIENENLLKKIAFTIAAYPV